MINRHCIDGSIVALYILPFVLFSNKSVRLAISTVPLVWFGLRKGLEIGNLNVGVELHHHVYTESPNPTSSPTAILHFHLRVASLNDVPNTRDG